MAMISRLFILSVNLYVDHNLQKCFIMLFFLNGELMEKLEYYPLILFSSSLMFYHRGNTEIRFLS